MSLSASIIYPLMHLSNERPNFLCSFVHGPPYWRLKVDFQEEPSGLGGSVGCPWVCVGDFNDIVSHNEKQGGRFSMGSFSTSLLHFMDNMGFVDLRFLGRTFTWCNGKFGLASVWERLDRSIANVNWRTEFPNA